ncbi:MAG TPA: DUF1345 domain-containing protein [Polyangia bacterium]|nr:DUF1345 domain-containing protein [Polyangia bacterium]
MKKEDRPGSWRSAPSIARLALGAGVGLLASAAVPQKYGVALRLVAGWDTSAIVMGALLWGLIFRASPDGTRRHAASDDPGRAVASLFWVVASLASLLATAVLLRRAKQCPPDVRSMLLVLGTFAVASSWFVTHTILALRYAHLYYRDGLEREGGLEFPGKGHPALIDFAYYAFTIGMCFQVSDVTVSSPSIRRTTLGHAMLSFGYNTVILAVAINLAIGIFG